MCIRVHHGGPLQNGDTIVQAMESGAQYLTTTMINGIPLPPQLYYS